MKIKQLQNSVSPVTCTPPMQKQKHWVHSDLRGAHATLKVSQGFLWGKKVVVLVLEVVKLQVACTIHPEQLVSCGTKIKRWKWWKRKKEVCTQRIKRPGQNDALKFFHSVVKCFSINYKNLSFFYWVTVSWSVADAPHSNQNNFTPPPSFPSLHLHETTKKWPQSNQKYFSRSNYGVKPTTPRADGEPKEWKKRIDIRQWIWTLHGRQTARHLVTAFTVSMPIKDETTCGDGCFCVGENTSIIKEEW